jgi:hypothetical protein
VEWYDGLVASSIRLYHLFNTFHVARMLVDLSYAKT